MVPVVVAEERIDLLGWLRAYGFKQVDLVRESGTSPAFIHDVVHGRRRLTERIRVAMRRLEERSRRQARVILGLNDRTTPDATVR